MYTYKYCKCITIARAATTMKTTRKAERRKYKYHDKNEFTKKKKKSTHGTI